MGVIFFVVNAVFATVILLMALWASVWALVSKNPDTRYAPMRDDRGSFIKSQTNLGTTELDALGVAARGDSRLAVPMTKRMDIGDDDDLDYSSGSNVPSSVGLAPLQRPSMSYEQDSYRDTPPRRSSMEQGLPITNRRPGTSQNEYSPSSSFRSPSPRNSFRPGTAPSQATAAAQHAMRQNNSSSPWQKGVGY